MKKDLNTEPRGFVHPQIRFTDFKSSKKSLDFSDFPDFLDFWECTRIFLSERPIGCFILTGYRSDIAII